MLIRVLEILVLGRKKDFAKPKGSPWGRGSRRSSPGPYPRKGLVKFAPITYIGGYVFHIGFSDRVLLLRAAYRADRQT